MNIFENFSVPCMALRAHGQFLQSEGWHFLEFDKYLYEFIFNKLSKVVWPQSINYNGITSTIKSQCVVLQSTLFDDIKENINIREILHLTPSQRKRADQVVLFI